MQGIFCSKMDSIKNTISSFQKLKKTKYRLILSSGRGRPIEEILLNFYEDDLYHILGFQHLTDIQLPKDKKTLFSNINSGKITDNHLSLSKYYDNKSLNYNIKLRIKMAAFLEDFLDSDDFTVSVYKFQHENNTVIQADYLITSKRITTDEEYYIFIRKRTEENTYGIISCFPKENISYWGGNRYIMLKEKIMEDNTSIILHIHPDFNK